MIFSENNRMNNEKKNISGKKYTLIGLVAGLVNGLFGGGGGNGYRTDALKVSPVRAKKGASNGYGGNYAYKHSQRDALSVRRAFPFKKRACSRYRSMRGRNNRRENFKQNRQGRCRKVFLLAYYRFGCKNVVCVISIIKNLAFYK